MADQQLKAHCPSRNLFFSSVTLNCHFQVLLSGVILFSVLAAADGKAPIAAVEEEDDDVPGES